MKDIIKNILSESVYDENLSDIYDILEDINQRELSQLFKLTEKIYLKHGEKDIEFILSNYDSIIDHLVKTNY